jgi:hypothetical protein
VASAHALAAEGAEKPATETQEKYDTETRRNAGHYGPENASEFSLAP